MANKLISIDDRSDHELAHAPPLILEEKGNDVFRNLKNYRLNIISIFGPARQGKSTLMNILSRREVMMVPIICPGLIVLNSLTRASFEYQTIGGPVQRVWMYPGPRSH